MMISPLQVMNMFGAVRPKNRERTPYADSARQSIPSSKEAAEVLRKLSEVNSDELAEEEVTLLSRAKTILYKLANEDSKDFLGLEENEFYELNSFIGSILTSQQIEIVEQQAHQESQDFVQKNEGFFQHLRDEGLNYDHLSDEQVEVMKLRMKERSVSSKMETNAEQIEGEVYYQYAVGPDNRMYKSGGVVMSRGKKVDADVVEKVQTYITLDNQQGQFADIDALLMPSNARTRSDSSR